MNRMPLSVTLALVGQSLISVGTHLCAKFATGFLPPMALVTLRLLFASAAYAVVLLALPREKRWPPRSTWLWLLGFGFLAGPVNQGFFIVGLSFSKATHASLLYALTPLGVYGVNVLLGREVKSVRRLVGIVVALSGVVVLLGQRGLGEAATPLIGDLLILVAVIAWVFWTTESRAFATEHGGLRTAAWSIIAGGFFMLPVAPFTLAELSWAAVPWAAWACLAYLVVLTSLVSYALWNYALSRVEASRVAIFANLQPVVTATAAWAFLGERFGLVALVAGLVVLLGVRVATTSR